MLVGPVLGSLLFYVTVLILKILRFAQDDIVGIPGRAGDDRWGILRGDWPIVGVSGRAGDDRVSCGGWLG